MILDDLKAQVESTVGVIDSAVVFISGIAERINAAVAAALANGATAEQLAPVTDEVTALKQKTNELATAIQNVP